MCSGREVIADFELEAHMILVPIVNAAADVGQAVALEQLEDIGITARDERRKVSTRCSGSVP